MRPESVVADALRTDTLSLGAYARFTLTLHCLGLLSSDAGASGARARAIAVRGGAGIGAADGVRTVASAPVAVPSRAPAPSTRRDAGSARVVVAEKGVPRRELASFVGDSTLYADEDGGADERFRAVLDEHFARVCALAAARAADDDSLGSEPKTPTWADFGADGAALALVGAAASAVAAVWRVGGIDATTPWSRVVCVHVSFGLFAGWLCCAALLSVGIALKAYGGGEPPRWILLALALAVVADRGRTIPARELVRTWRGPRTLLLLAVLLH